MREIWMSMRKIRMSAWPYPAMIVCPMLCLRSDWKQAQISRRKSVFASEPPGLEEEEITVQYSTVQYSTVQYSSVQYSTVQYSTVPTVMYMIWQNNTAFKYSHSWLHILEPSIPGKSQIFHKLRALGWGRGDKKLATVWARLLWWSSSFFCQQVYIPRNYFLKKKNKKKIILDHLGPIWKSNTHCGGVPRVHSSERKYQIFFTLSLMSGPKLTTMSPKGRS